MAVFSVILDDRDLAHGVPRATCDRCGVELVYTPTVLTVLRVKGLNEAIARYPGRVHELAQLVREAHAEGRPLMVDASVEVERAPTSDLHQVLVAHATTCRGP